MRILSFHNQNEVYKRIVNIILELRKNDTNSAADAISDAFDIAYIVGGDAMLEALSPSRVRIKTAAEQFADALSRTVEKFDELADGIEVRADD